MSLLRRAQLTAQLHLRTHRNLTLTSHTHTLAHSLHSPLSTPLHRFPSLTLTSTSTFHTCAASRRRPKFASRQAGGEEDVQDVAYDRSARESRARAALLHEEAVAIVDTAALAHNARWLKQGVQRKAGREVESMCVVKANGYGHGAVEAARAALGGGGASALGVARFSEAVELREAGIDAPVLLLGNLPPLRYAEALQYGLSVTVHNEESTRLLVEATKATGMRAKVHVKVDTGMSRLGWQVDEVPRALELLREGDVEVEGVFAHFARADEDTHHTHEQTQLFEDALGMFKEAGVRPRWVHAANSAASLWQPASTYFDLVRLGIAFYGLRPTPAEPLPHGLQPALAWYTQVTAVKTLPPGRGVSYGHQFVTEKHHRVGTCSIGYACGYRRTAGNKVLVGGQVRAVLGRVCMDQIMIDMDGVDAGVGDEVVLLGDQGDASLPCAELSDNWNTIDYEVTCGIGRRVPRVYI